MKKSKIIFLLASSMLLMTRPNILSSMPIIYASNQIQNNANIFTIEKNLENFVSELKKEAKEKQVTEIFVQRLGSEELHNHSSINVDTIKSPEDLFKSDNPKLDITDYVFVKLKGKTIAGVNRVLIMNARDVIVDNEEEYKKEFEKRLDNIEDFSYNNAQIHSLSPIKEDKIFFTLIDAHGVWMGKAIKETTVADVKLYSRELKIENKLTVNYGLVESQKKDGYNYNITFDNFAKNDAKLKEMIDEAGITQEDEDREKIKKFALRMGKVYYDFATLYGSHYEERYNTASDLFAVTERNFAMCMGFSTTAARAFNLLGIPSYVATAKVPGGGLHVVTRSFYDGRWNTVDLTSSRRDTDENGFIGGFERNENSYKEIKTDDSPKESLAHTIHLNEAEVIINTKYEEWAKEQDIEKLVLINTDAIYEWAKGQSAIERDPEEKVEERLALRKKKEQEAKERFEREEAERDRKWKEWEAKQKEVQEAMKKELLEKSLEFEKLEAQRKAEQEKAEQEKAKKALEKELNEKENHSKSEEVEIENKEENTQENQKKDNEVTNQDANTNQNIEKEDKKDNTEDKKDESNISISNTEAQKEEQNEKGENLLKELKTEKESSQINKQEDIKENDSNLEKEKQAQSIKFNKALSGSTSNRGGSGGGSRGGSGGGGGSRGGSGGGGGAGFARNKKAALDKNNNFSSKQGIKLNWTYNKSDLSWYVLDERGNKQTNKWIQDTDNKWYYMLEDGKMASNRWYYDSKYLAWYYFEPNGEMSTNKWVKSSDNKWYYLMADGKMAVSRYIDSYYVNANGVWENK